MKVTKYQEEQICARMKHYFQEADRIEKSGLLFGMASEQENREYNTICTKMEEMQNTLNLLGLAVMIDPKTGEAILQR